MRVGLGQLGLAPSHFWAMTVPEFAAAVSGASEVKEREEQLSMERTRLLAFWTMSVHIKKGASFTPQSLARFPWEIDKGNKPTKEQVDATRERLKKLLKKKPSDVSKGLNLNQNT